VLSQRIRMSPAARIRRRLCDDLGHVVEIDDVVLSTFPGPECLVEASSISGLAQFKVERLRATPRPRSTAGSTR